MTLDTGPKMFSHQDPVDNPDIKQGETNDNPFQAFKIGSNYSKYTYPYFLDISIQVQKSVFYLLLFSLKGI